MKRVVAFSGGRGSESLISSWNKVKHFDLDLIVNPYDDGLSTGRIREYIPGYLGPSDFRKNLVHYLNSSQGRFDNFLANAFEARVDSFEEGLLLLKSIDDQVESPSDRIQIDELVSTLQNFRQFELKSTDDFDYRDCALGNLILAGKFLECNSDFQKSVDEISALLALQMGVYTVSNENDISLVAITSKNEFLARENLIVNGLYAGAVTRLGFLKSSEITVDPLFHSGIRSAEDLDLIEGRFLNPEPTASAIQRIDSADVLCYLPGTQNSSLFPSYRITGDAIHSTQAKSKLLILNLTRDHDMANWMRADIIKNALMHMGDPKNENRSITHVLLNSPSTDSTLLDGPIHDYCSDYAIELILKQTADKSSLAKHSGAIIIETLLQLL